MAKRSKVARMSLSPATALRIVGQLAKDSNKVFFVAHALMRMRQRKISRPQVLACLLRGGLIEGPAIDVKGNWRFTMRYVAAGDTVSVVVALDWQVQSSSHVLIITVFGG